MGMIHSTTAAIRLIFTTQINYVMIQVKEVTDQYKGDYEHYINRVIREQTEAGWKLIDIKHSVAANSSGKVFSALLIFDDSPTTDFPTSLNQ